MAEPFRDRSSELVHFRCTRGWFRSAWCLVFLWLVACADGQSPERLDDIGTGGRIASGGSADAGAGGRSESGAGGGSGGLATGGGVGGNGSGGVSTGGGNAAGGASDDGPCAVPDYIVSDVVPVGWASMDGGTTGGGAIVPILVSNLADFKAQAEGDEAKVIYVQGTFAPASIEIGSNKTIIGCSSGAHLQGHLDLGSGTSNVILRNLTISGYAIGNCALDPHYDSGEGCSSGEDAISVHGTAHHVWVDHCSIQDGTDGNLDITNEADYVTVSWTKFSYTLRTDDSGSDSTGASGHRYSNLVGGTDTAPEGFDSDDPLGTAPLNVTWHHNWWADNVVERMPRVRYGRNHLFNNYFNSSTSNYCIRAGIYAHILLEGNYFDGVSSPHQFNSDSNRGTAHIARGEGARTNVYVDTSDEEEVGGEGVPWTNPEYEYVVEAGAGVPDAVQSGAGPH